MRLKNKLKSMLGSMLELFRPVPAGTTTSSPAATTTASSSVELPRDSGTVSRTTYGTATTTLALAPALAASGAILGSLSPSGTDTGAGLSGVAYANVDTAAAPLTPNLVASPITPRSHSFSGKDVGVMQYVTEGPSSAVEVTLWDQALSRLREEDREGIDFQKNNKIDLLQEFFRETEKKKQECEEKQWSYRNSRGEKVTYAETLLLQLSRYIAIGDVALQHNPDIVALVWAGFRLILQVATASVRNMRLIFESLEYLVGVLSRCDIYEKLYIGRRLQASELLKASLINLYVSILEYLCSARRKLSDAGAARFVKGIFSDLGQLFKKIQECEKDVMINADTAGKEAAGMGGFGPNSRVAHEEGAEQLKTLLVEIQEQNSIIGRMAMDIYTYVEKEKRLKILMWLSNVPFRDHHLFLRAGRHGDTGQWLLQKEEFMQWRKSSSSSILWLRGDGKDAYFPHTLTIASKLIRSLEISAGCGKTILASKVIDEIQPQESTEEHAVAYFYCNYREEARRDPGSILRALIKQFCLIFPQDELPTPVLSVYQERERNGHISGPLNLNESKNLIIDLSKGFSQSTIIIDALDECNRSTRRDLLRILKEIVTSTKNIRIFVTGRNDGDISKMMEDSPSYYIDAADNTTDIDTYIRSEVGRCFAEGLLPNDEELRDEVISILSAGANGMFMWAHFQILAICKEHTPGHIRNALARLPKDLDETYTRILKRINDQSENAVSTAKRVLKWLLYVKELNSPEIVSEFLSVKPGQAILADTWTQSQILDICQNLVVYDKGLNVLRFTHFSVQEFLLRQSEFSHEEETSTNMTSAEVCLTVLTYHYSGAQNCPTPALLKYATSNWAYRVRLLDVRSTTLEELLARFNPLSDCYKEWVSSFLERKYGVGCETAILRKAFDCELYDMFKFLIESGMVSHCSDHCMESLLYSAVSRGCLDLVQLLVAQEGMDINYKIDGSTLLHYAMEKGNVEVMQILLGLDGLDISSRNTEGYTPLEWALSSRKEEMMEMILQKDGVDPESTFKALSWAAWNDKEKIVQVILEKGLMNFQYIQGALFLAASEGNGNVVELILKKGGPESGGAQEALSVVAENGVEKAVRIILEKGEMSLEGIEKALLLAKERGHQRVVYMLKEQARKYDPTA